MTIEDKNPGPEGITTTGWGNGTRGLILAGTGGGVGVESWEGV